MKKALTLQEEQILKWKLLTSGRTLTSSLATFSPLSRPT